MSDINMYDLSIVIGEPEWCLISGRICVLYVSFGSKVRPRTFGCIAMGNTVLFNLRSQITLIYRNNFPHINNAISLSPSQ